MRRFIPPREGDLTAMRCDRCHRPMKGTTAYDGACECGGLIEAGTGVPFDVDALPRREAHALFALFAWCHENPNSIPTASEVCLFDEEATGPRATGAALQRAARRGLCICGGGRYWAPVGAALVAGRQPFEDRVARDLGWPE